MGIQDLWKIFDLESIKHEKCLADFRGKKLAIDLSGWLVECKIKTAEYANRCIFFRVLDLMSNGITPVFVADSLIPSPLKERKRGQEFFNLAEQWKEVLTAMGFQFIRSLGEAEKTCAHLTSSKAVDGCVTNDGDAFGYGATTVLKCFKTKSKEIHLYEKSEIVEKLGLDQREMVAGALLTGCDFCSGINGIGIKKFLQLVKELKRNHVNDILDWMRSLRTSEQLSSLKKTMEEKNSMKKEAHCSKCSHLGSVSKHNKNGCVLCSTCEGCKDSDNISCSCQFHTLEGRVDPFLTELKVYEAALMQSNFPNEDVITEFLSEDKSISKETNLSAKKPNCQEVIQLLRGSLGINQKDTKQFFPALVKMSLYGQLPDVTISPARVVKKCRKDKEQCYLVEFHKFEFDSSKKEEGEKNVYEIHVVQSIFDEKFPQWSLANDEEESKGKQGVSKSVSRKRGQQGDTSQPKITDLFKITKTDHRRGKNADI